MEQPGSGLAGNLAAKIAHSAEVAETESIKGLASVSDCDRLRAETAADKAAKKLTPEQRAERKARKKEIMDRNLSIRETWRRLSELDAEYR